MEVIHRRPPWLTGSYHPRLTDEQFEHYATHGYCPGPPAALKRP
jgi:hypothetical protein